MDEKPERRSLDIFLTNKDVGASPFSPSRCFYLDMPRQATEPAKDDTLRQTSNDNAFALGKKLIFSRQKQSFSYLCSLIQIKQPMKVFVFPGQGAQFVGMGANLYQESAQGREWFEEANRILGFRITDLMFTGTDDDLRRTKVTQPAIFLHSVILARTLGDDFQPAMVAGHSLGEFSALVAAGALSFEEGLQLVYQRALAMQQASEDHPGTMAAILGLPDETVASVCAAIDDTVVPANYNCPGQIAISGTLTGIDEACRQLLERGAKRAVKLNVGGAFHSPLMEPARAKLEEAIQAASFKRPLCPVYQNVSTRGETDPEVIKANLISQLTAPVKWTQSVRNMIADGADEFTELGPGNVLQGLIGKIRAQ
jgi:[acyl-carrier-protein] S-malonyltransferase